jgi:hypothetical protein
MAELIEDGKPIDPLLAACASSLIVHRRQPRSASELRRDLFLPVDAALCLVATVEPSWLEKSGCFDSKP